ncbi:Hypothetical predicted protein [Cloeon dipterum]|uniref:L-Fucosyltransferase n=1 Tax=Cloeon dipterum TaxID=197152 RepID=A0A8S1C9N2_9INSE|nr:Hypothetical predicted protein [Cloeon dipterum]
MRNRKKLLLALLVTTACIFTSFLGTQQYTVLPLSPASYFQEVKPTTIKPPISTNEATTPAPTTTTSSSTSTTTVATETTTTLRPRAFNPIDPESIFWSSCPEPGLGRNSSFVTAFVDGRLGNVVWSYLSVLAAAKRYNLRPIFDQKSLDVLAAMAFDERFLRVPSEQWLDQKCGMHGEFVNVSTQKIKVMSSWKDMFRYVETPPKEGFEFYKYNFYVADSEVTTPYWYDLKKELVLKDKFKSEATRQLKEYKDEFQEQIGRNLSNIEFVGIHVRRSDYIYHMSVVYPGSTSAGPGFFQAAINWLKKNLQRPLIFVVVSDDRQWTEENIVGNSTDVFLAGSSDWDQPGEDLAILAACNHTIFAYGTFGLTGALLANRPGGFTIIFDPLNGTVTKEMEFGSNLPGWRIMDEQGNIHYQDTRLTYAYFVHPRLGAENN